MTTSNQRVTILDVARAAGVSTATVARALKNSPKVVPATRDRVSAIAREMGYSPNPMASDLRRGNRLRAVGLITTGFTNVFQASVAAGAETELRRRGLELVIGSTNGDTTREPELAQTMIDRRVSALLTMPDGEDRDYLRPEHTYGTPVILVGRPANGLDVDVVMTSDDHAVAEATAQLTGLGHRRIAALAGRADSFRATQRLAGFRTAIARGRGDLDPSLVVTDLMTPDSARAAMEDLMRAPVPPTAVLALNLGISTGVLIDRIVHQRELAFIALDETDVSAGLAISAIVRDPLEIGRQAAQLALARIEEPERSSRTVDFPYRLIRRGSGEIAPPGP